MTSRDTTDNQISHISNEQFRAYLERCRVYYPVLDLQVVHWNSLHYVLKRGDTWEDLSRVKNRGCMYTILHTLANVAYPDNVLRLNSYKIEREHEMKSAELEEEAAATSSSSL